MVIFCDTSCAYYKHASHTCFKLFFSSWNAFQTDADFNGLKVFGSLCYASTLSTNWRKFDPRASKCVFISCPRGTKGYILLNIQSREIFVSRDVVFYEHVFPYQMVQDTSNETNSPNIDDQILFAED